MAAARRRQGRQFYVWHGPLRKPQAPQPLPQATGVAGHSPESFSMLRQDHPLREGYVEASTALGLVQGEALRIGPDKDPFGGCGGTQANQPKPESHHQRHCHQCALQGRTMQSGGAGSGRIQVVKGASSFRFPGNRPSGLHPDQDWAWSPTSTRRIKLGPATQTSHCLPKQYHS